MFNLPIEPLNRKVDKKKIYSKAEIKNKINKKNIDEIERII